MAVESSIRLTGTRSSDRPITASEIIQAGMLDEIRPIIHDAADRIRDEIARGGLWVNVLAGHAPDQMSGKPSQSTGLSGESWLSLSGASASTIQVVLENDVDYAEYVHFPGEDTGQCLDDTRAYFEAEMVNLESVLADKVRDYMRNL